MTIPRSMFISSTAAAFASIAIVRSPAKAAQFEYKFGTDVPADHPVNIRAIQMWNAIKEETGGRLAVSVFPNNQLGGDPAMLQEIRTGALEFMAATGAGVTGLVFPLAAIESVGFAFSSSKNVFEAMDGALGDYIRKELNARTDLGIHMFSHPWEHGFRQITTSAKPIKSVDDLAGLKIRTPESKIWVQLFQALGASPVALNFSEVYTALQTHVADGQENPFAVIEVGKLYEVQKYLSITNHMWAGYSFIANAKVWNGLPRDIQATVEKNIAKYAVIQRRDTIALNNSLAAKLAQQGMQITTPDPTPFRRKLGKYYAEWKGNFGSTAWSLLEKYTGRLG